MLQGDKSSYTHKQERHAANIEADYENNGVGSKPAERLAWSTVDKLSGGAKKSGSGSKGLKQT